MESDMTEQLKPCPFCSENGFDIELVCCDRPIVDSDGFAMCCGSSDAQQIPCEACECTGMITQERINEINAWNPRAQQESDNANG